MHVFFMEKEDIILVQEGETETEVKEDSEAKEQLVTISLNLVLGNVENGTNTMCIKGTMGNKTLHILLDNRSSHNFLSDRFSKVAIGKIT